MKVDLPDLALQQWLFRMWYARPICQLILPIYYENILVFLNWLYEHTLNEDFHLRFCELWIFDFIIRYTFHLQTESEPTIYHDQFSKA